MASMVEVKRHLQSALAEQGFSMKALYNQDLRDLTTYLGPVAVRGEWKGRLVRHTTYQINGDTANFCIPSSKFKGITYSFDQTSNILTVRKTDCVVRQVMSVLQKQFSDKQVTLIGACNCAISVCIQVGKKMTGTKLKKSVTRCVAQYLDPSVDVSTQNKKQDTIVCQITLLKPQWLS